MKLIFLKDVGGVARHNEVKEISDGYALNYLIPRGLAVQATPDKLATHQSRMKQNAESVAVHDAQVAKALEGLDGKQVVIKAKANEKGHLFKGVNKDDVIGGLGDLAAGFITPDMIDGAFGAIREVGEHAIHLAGAGAEATINLVIEAAN